jgi:hypothetical protein
MAMVLNHRRDRGSEAFVREEILIPFAAYPSLIVYKIPGDSSKRNAIHHLIRGDERALMTAHGTAELRAA